MGESSKKSARVSQLLKQILNNKSNSQTIPIESEPTPKPSPMVRPFMSVANSVLQSRLPSEHNTPRGLVSIDIGHDQSNYIATLLGDKRERKVSRSPDFRPHVRALSTKDNNVFNRAKSVDKAAVMEKRVLNNRSPKPFKPSDTIDDSRLLMIGGKVKQF